MKKEDTEERSDKGAPGITTKQSAKGSYADIMSDRRGSIRQLLSIFGFDPITEHSYEAIRQLEKLIDAHYPVGHSPMPTTMIPFGWYLTHTLHKNLPNAKINTDVESVWDISISYKPTWKNKDEKGGTMEVWPFRRVSKFWKNREDSMSAMLEMTMLLATKDPSTFEDMADDEGWVTLPSGTMFRAMAAETDEDGKILGGKIKLNASKLIKGL